MGIVAQFFIGGVCASRLHLRIPNEPPRKEIEEKRDPLESAPSNRASIILPSPDSYQRIM
jgi:hypothetical protein